MKILFLANRVPYPPYRGDKLKIFNLARRLHQDHELHLLTFAQTQEDLGYQQELEKVFKKVHFIYLPKWRSALQCLTCLWDRKPLQVLYFQSAAMQRALDSMIAQEQYDSIHIQHLRMSPYLRNRSDLARILDLPDAFSLYWERRSKVKRSLLTTVFEHFERRRVLRYEQVLKDFDLSLVCSSEDLDYLRQKHGADNLKLLPNGVDLDTFRARDHDYSHNKTLLFTGNMDYAPNVDAVGYFVRDILPIVSVAHPDVKFVIAGQRPVPAVTALAADNVEVTGFIKDLAVTYDSASVVVAPLRFGAGTQNKVLEAMAMGIPVVCSNIGFKGLGIASGEGAVMQTDTAAFAQSIIDLLASQDARKTMGHMGKRVIQERFDWNIIAKTLESYLVAVAERKAKTN